MSKKYKMKIQKCRNLLRKLRSRRDGLGIQQYNATRWEYLQLLEQQEIYRKQRAKQFWLREGDRHSIFLQLCVNSEKE